MTRQFPAEIFIGQRVYLRFEPSGHPITSQVTYLDYQNGRVHLKPVGYARQWAAHPRAVTSLSGEYLHFDKDTFYFSHQPNLQ
jgi:hypothetical protein